MDGFAPCVCHKGITWDTKDLKDDGTCPLSEWEREDADNGESE